MFDEIKKLVKGKIKQEPIILFVQDDTDDYD